MIIKPMLAATLQGGFEVVPYPVLATPKLDGIRCCTVEGQALSRNFKAIPNRHVRLSVESIGIDGLDGELMTPGDFNSVQSNIMTQSGNPNFKYMIFDYVKGSLNKPYVDRIGDLLELQLPKFCEKVIPQQISNPSELEQYEEAAIKLGFEGVMLRTHDSPYKAGRSTLNQFWLVKIKRFWDSEAEVLAVHELMRNVNEAFTGELGQTVRRKTLDGQIGGDMMGKLHVRDVVTQKEFFVGSGFNDEQRIKIWRHPNNYIGRIMTYKYLPHGMKDLPRHPIFLHWRIKE